ncbi:hypothetical protein HI914_02552 [Erysiphe necator]|nr:hypothetical protein HI914_02552 [Erysiphe necator]
MFPPDSQSDLKLEVRRTRDQAGIIIAKIEQIFESIVDCILEGKAMMIHLKIRENSKLKNKPLQISTSSSSSTNEEKTRKVCFPSRNPSEAWKFTVLLRILELCHEALVTGIVITKRLLQLKA